MSAPLIGLAAPGALMGLAIALLFGVAFGIFLEQAGLGNARKLTGQFYLRDLSVLKATFSAVITALLGLFWLSRIGLVDLSRVYIPPTFVAPQLLGAVTFGVGMVVAGLCPGTSCVALSSGHADGVAVAVGLALGVAAFNEAFPSFEEFYRTTPLGPLTLPEALGVPYGVVVLGVVVLGLLGFAVAERLEKRVQALQNGPTESGSGAGRG